MFVCFLPLCPMHILIGESGSTKTDWAYLTENDTKLFTTKGLNPNHLACDEIKEILREETGRQTELSSVEKLFFYGAGLGNDNAKTFLYSTFEQIFVNLKSIVLAHDLLGAAHALYAPGEKGIVCILGTGSVAGYFDGQDIVRTTGGLGYLLGDEGSGTHMGKLLIAEYAQKKLPHHLETALHEYTGVRNTEVLHFLYKEPHPNRFLSELTHFLLSYRKEMAIKTIIKASFETFYQYDLEYLLSLYPEYKTIRCVGSVGYLFQEELKEVMQKHNVFTDKIIQKPIIGIVEKYKNTGML